ncbi:MAG TPA: hypothetical protein VGA27_15985 [Candidatus Binatia bacterium]
MNSKLKELWLGWTKIAKKIGDFQARLILTLFYFIFIIPTGLIARRFADPLALKNNAANWAKRTSAPARLDDARRQF